MESARWPDGIFIESGATLREAAMEKKELVAMLMESPFYFDILLGHRLVIVQQHAPRFLDKTMLNQSIDSKKFTDSIVVDERDVGKVPLGR